MEALQAKATASQIKAQSIATPVASTTTKVASSPKTTTKKSSAASSPPAKSGRGFANIKAQSMKSSVNESGRATNVASSPETTHQKATNLAQPAAEDSTIVAVVATPSTGEEPAMSVTAEQAEIERISRLKAAEDARKSSESKRVTAALEKLSKEPSSQSAQQLDLKEGLQAVTNPGAAKVFVGTKVSLLPHFTNIVSAH